MSSIIKPVIWLSVIGFAAYLGHWFTIQGFEKAMETTAEHRPKNVTSVNEQPQVITQAVPEQSSSELSSSDESHKTTNLKGGGATVLPIRQVRHVTHDKVSERKKTGQVEQRVKEVVSANVVQGESVMIESDITEPDSGIEQSLEIPRTTKSESIVSLNPNLQQNPISEGLPSLGAVLDKIAAVRDDQATEVALIGDRYTLFVFWASWCFPCQQMFTDLIQIARTYPNQVDVLFLNVDEDPQDMFEFLNEQADVFRYTLPVVAPKPTLDDLVKDFNVVAMPALFFYRPSGEIEKIHKEYKPGDVVLFSRFFEEQAIEFLPARVAEN